MRLTTFRGFDMMLDSAFSSDEHVATVSISKLSGFLEEIRQLFSKVLATPKGSFIK